MIKKLRKYYISPEIDTIKLDRDIVLLTSTTPPPDPDVANPGGIDKPTFIPNSAPPSSTSTPFGGNSPDYGDM
jgi:hypothetical protein